jgi:hypothetical protein
MQFGLSRPNRLDKSIKKEEYDLQMSRFIVDSINSHPLHRHFISKTLINWNFYKNRQWIFSEDLASFLMDESGDARNRIKITENIVRPIVEQYVGNAIRMGFDAEARGISERAINRREQEKLRLIFQNEVAREQGGIFKDAFQGRIPLGDTPEEVEEIFENVYVDEVDTNVNRLVQWIAEFNDFEEKKVNVAKNLAISGMPIIKNHEYNGHQIFKVVDPLFYFFDRNAKRNDLRDAEYMGEFMYMLPSELFERFQEISDTQREAIEEYTRHNTSATQETLESMLQSYYGSGISGRVPVYEIYWKDVEVREYGYVVDEDGYTTFAMINHEDSPYTDKDLIKAPDDTKFARLMKGKMKRKMYTDVLRYCIYVPNDVISNPDNIGQDIVLESGLVPYQETDLLEPSNVEFPYKVYCWGYHNGDVLSPIDDIIDPQRFLNRVLSVAESHVNNSRGAGTIIDKDTVDAQGGEEEILRNMNLSKPVFINAKGNLNNSVGSYDATIGNGTFSMFEVANQMRNMVGGITGVNESMQGTQGGKRELVGVTEAAIQRGTLMQEPFYFALSRCLLQCYEAMAKQGVRIYADHPKRLATIAGDEGARLLTITQDMKLETFRLFMKRTASREQQITAGNELLFGLLQSQLIDQTAFADLFNRSSVEEIARALRAKAKEAIEQQRLAAQQETDAQGEMDARAAEIEAQAGALERSEQLREDTNRQADRDAKTEQALIAAMSKNQGQA